MEVYIHGKRIPLDPKKSIGQGGEANVFDIGNGKALKVFKPPTHPDYQGYPNEQNAAKERIVHHQEKLRGFPQNLPKRVVVPEDLATDRSGRKILGYTMKYLRGIEALYRYSEKEFRQNGIANNTVVEIFRNLHTTVKGVHKAGVIIGDFNDLNVLVQEKEAYIIDSDSFQFGKFFCTMFTAKFLDPLLCDPRASSLILHIPYRASSDWYAYNAILMQCLLFVGPYGGIYKPQKTTQRIVHDARPLHRITIFHPEVIYPKPAVNYQVLPDDLLQHFYQTFVKDRREEFPQSLLERMRWTKCTVCSAEHARSLCPMCAQTTAQIIKEVTVVRGKVIATRIFNTRGIIVYATVQNNKLRWLYHEAGSYVREDKSIALKGDLNPKLRFRIQGDETLVAQLGRMSVFRKGAPQERYAIESYDELPIFDANGQHRYWTHNGQLLRDGTLGQEYIGDVLSWQTLFWIGPSFGFGFYRAGNLNIAFVFNASQRGINDRVSIPPIRGHLIDATCMFSSNSRDPSGDLCWFLTATVEGGREIHRCTVIKRDGTIEAGDETLRGDGSWLSSIRGKCAAGNFLLSPTDEGIIRVEIDGGKIVKTKEFPDTEPFVDESSHLFPSDDGLYVVSRQEITRLKLT